MILMCDWHEVQAESMTQSCLVLLFFSNTTECSQWPTGEIEPSRVASYRRLGSRLRAFYEVRLANQVLFVSSDWDRSGHQSIFHFSSWHLTRFADIYIHLAWNPRNWPDCFCITSRIFPEIKNDGFQARKSSRPLKGQSAKVRFGSVKWC